MLELQLHALLTLTLYGVSRGDRDTRGGRFFDTRWTGTWMVLRTGLPKIGP